MIYALNATTDFLTWNFNEWASGVNALIPMDEEGVRFAKTLCNMGIVKGLMLGPVALFEGVTLVQSPHKNVLDVDAINTFASGPMFFLYHVESGEHRGKYRHFNIKYARIG